MIIQFRTSTKYIKLTESNIYKTLTVRFTTRLGDYTVYEITYQQYTLFTLTETERQLNILVTTDLPLDLVSSSPSLEVCRLSPVYLITYLLHGAESLLRS